MEEVELPNKCKCSRDQAEMERVKRLIEIQGADERPDKPYNAYRQPSLARLQESTTKRKRRLRVAKCRNHALTKS